MTGTPQARDSGDEQVWHLQHCPLLAGISQQEWQHLREATVTVKLEPRDHLLADPADPGAFYLIVEGLMSLTCGQVEGRGAAVLLGPGDLFGAMDGAGSVEFGQHVAVLMPTVLYRMAQPQMSALLDRCPDIGYRITKVSWRRIARLQRLLAQIMARPVRVRLAALLLDLASQYGRDRGDGARSVGLSLTHGDLARLVGSSRELVSEAMGALCEVGWIRAGGKQVDLIDRQALERIADAGQR